MVIHAGSGLYAVVKIPFPDPGTDVVRMRALKELCTTPLGDHEILNYIETPVMPESLPKNVVTSSSTSSGTGSSIKLLRKYPLTVFFGCENRPISFYPPLEVYIATLTVDDHAGWCKVYATGNGVEPPKDADGRDLPWYLNSEFEAPSATLIGTKEKKITLSLQQCTLKEGTRLGNGQLLPSDVEDTLDKWTVFTFYYATRDQLDALGVLPEVLSTRPGNLDCGPLASSLDFLRNANMNLISLLSSTQLYSFIRGLLDSSMLVNVPEESFNGLVMAFRRVGSDSLTQLQNEERRAQSSSRPRSDSMSSSISMSSPRSAKRVPPPFGQNDQMGTFEGQSSFNLTPPIHLGDPIKTPHRITTNSSGGAAAVGTMHSSPTQTPRSMISLRTTLQSPAVIYSDPKPSSSSSSCSSQSSTFSPTAPNPLTGDLTSSSGRRSNKATTPGVLEDSAQTSPVERVKSVLGDRGNLNVVLKAPTIVGEKPIQSAVQDLRVSQGVENA